MKDPLAGKRQAINDGELDVLIWADRGQGCPVAVGQTFPLRRCAIEITSVRRVKQGRGHWFWKATFARIERVTRPYLLAARGGGDEGHGYVREEGALSSGEERPDWSPDAAGFLTVPQGPPPEPEAVPPAEVRNLPTSVAAKARFAEQRQEDIQRRMSRSVIEELRQATAEARRVGVDVGDELEVVREAIAAIKAKQQRQVAA